MVVHHRHLILRDVGRPEPHPLDCDWRFTPDTTQMLAHRLHRTRCVLAGAPTVAAALVEQGDAVTLVERQPGLALPQATVDIEVAPATGETFEAAFADPPWYPTEYERWITWVAQHIPRGGRIYASLWPEDTRPSAAAERHTLLSALARWATVRVDAAQLEYQVPPFEKVARSLQLIEDADRPWRRGDLVELVVEERPSLAPPLVRREAWRRFVWNEYQLALRVRPAQPGPFSIAPVPGARSWRWPSVSRRAPNRDRIDLWSSRNEVAVIMGAADVGDALAAFSDSSGTNTAMLPAGLAAVLHDWELPRPPFTRVLQWTHLA
ncbi:Hypothetical protein I5071_81230 [Sandaracinus amylolyticus]|nr:Hypothetical protein I5071_81230 [Sandaracinus amylolyticus]